MTRPSSLSGAAYYQGVLIGLQNSPCFSDDTVKVQFSYEQQELQNIDITNLTKISQVKGIRRHYQPSQQFQIQNVVQDTKVLKCLRSRGFVSICGISVMLYLVIDQVCLQVAQGKRILFLKGRLDKGFRDHD